MTIDLPKRVKKAPLPNLKGLHVDTAIKHLNNLGFNNVRAHFIEDYGDTDVVLRQHPEKSVLKFITTQITLYINKTSNINYLPSVYRQEDLTGRNFLREFLWIPQHITDAITDKLDNIDRYFNPLTAPEPFLNWIASWLALPVEPSWELEEKRKIIKKAAALLRLRGTKTALKEMINIFLKFDVEIKENAWPVDGFVMGVTARIDKRCMIIEKKNLHHCFTVKVPKTEEELTTEELHRLHWVIRQEKPAHTEYFITFKEVEMKQLFHPVLTVGVDRIGDETSAA